MDFELCSLHALYKIFIHMSANNFIHIEEVSPEKFSVIEKDYESYVKIQTIGFFHSMKLAIRKAEEHIKNHEYEVEYGIRFFLKEEDITNKDFDVWNVKKKCAEKEKSRLYTVREVWWCRLGINIGSEQDGHGAEFLRPTVIVRGFGASICMIIPLTTSIHQHPLRVNVGEIQGKKASAILSQIRVVDTRRLVEKIGFLDKEIFKQLRKTARSLF